MAEHRVNMRELHEATGIRKATISAYYNDTYKQISKEHLDELCKYFECSLSELIEYIPDETKPTPKQKK